MFCLRVIISFPTAVMGIELKVMQSCLMMSFELNMLLFACQYILMALILLFSLCTLVMIFGIKNNM